MSGKECAKLCMRVLMGTRVVVVVVFFGGGGVQEEEPRQPGAVSMVGRRFRQDGAVCGRGGNKRFDVEGTGGTWGSQPWPLSAA